MKRTAKSSRINRRERLKEFSITADYNNVVSNIAPKKWNRDMVKYEHGITARYCGAAGKFYITPITELRYIRTLTYPDAQKVMDYINHNFDKGGKECAYQSTGAIGAQLSAKNWEKTIRYMKTLRLDFDLVDRNEKPVNII